MHIHLHNYGYFLSICRPKLAAKKKKKKIPGNSHCQTSKALDLTFEITTQVFHAVISSVNTRFVCVT